MDKVHPSVVVFLAILVMDSALVERAHRLVRLRSLTSQLLSLFINLGLGAFRHPKHQEDIFHLVDLAQIILHISHGHICMTTLLCHHIEVDKRPDALESTFERYHLCAIWLP